MSAITIVPSLPAQTFREIEGLVSCLAPRIAEFQVDIVDGNFAQPVAWPYTESEPLTALLKLQQLAPTVAIELDCMIKNPEHIVDQALRCGVSRMVIHFGSTDNYAAVAERLQEEGVLVGLAITNDADLDEVQALRPLFDYVQVMGIAVVGKQGQPFDERTIETLKQLRQHDRDGVLAVDGAVNAETIPRLVAAGANRLAPGSAIAQAKDPVAALGVLQQVAQH